MKGGRKTKGRRGNKVRNEVKKKNDDYEDEGEPEGDDEECPEPKIPVSIRSIR